MRADIAILFLAGAFMLCSCRYEPPAEADIVFTQIFELAGRGIAVESEREQNTFEHLHAIISIRIAMREIDKLKHIDSFHDFFHGSGDIVRIEESS